jgi:universal stress protein E
MPPLHRILVATDFSPAGQRAVTRAAELAREHAAALDLVHATPDWSFFSRWASARPEHYEEITRRAQTELENELTRVQSTFGISARGAVQKGKASEVIARAIRALAPDIVVAGARGEHQPRVAPAALGGTSLKLFFHAEHPLLFVREGDALRYRTSIAAVNEPTDLSKRVILWASALVPNGKCHIVHAYDAPYSERMRLCGMDNVAIETCIRATEAAARESLDELVAAVVKDAHPHLHLVQGNPLGILVTEIARHCPQLVVVGRHELERGESLHNPFGSMGLRMAYHIPVDVLVIP